MKKSFIILVTLLSSCLTGCKDHSLDPVQDEVATAWRAGGEAVNQGEGVAVDGNGNLYVTGTFQGTATFGTTTLTASGESDVFVAKYTGKGSLLWVKKAGGAGVDGGYSIAVDAGNSVYITGSFQGSATFGTTTLTSLGDSDMFIAKYNSSGDVVWSKKVGETGEDTGYGITVDNGGNIYVTGGLTKVPSDNSSSRPGTVYIAKLSGTGDVQWELKGEGTNEYNKGKGIAVDGSGNIYVTGQIVGTLTFGTTTLATNNQEVFTLKLSSNGDVQWAQKSQGIFFATTNAIAIDGSGNVYVGGLFRNSIRFGSLSIGAHPTSHDAFLVKYGPTGEVQWLKQVGAQYASVVDDDVNGIAVNESGNVYVTGKFGKLANMFSDKTLTASGESDAYIVKMTSSGDVEWAHKAGGTGFDYGRGIAVTKQGAVYITGSFSSTGTFGSTTLTAGGVRDIFVARY
ncbi:SBBP repeat-containing protein [Telluribacter sp. SYSU D00476]|uniref:SBBP repeat-containing protein n=1 Tax=Telluribacter sp. SYSU D00476 TaxID=2811430 RepID=UPI001FF28254|nr:SBBP repeat-containing protein [Telluribacter sp. SYSU D00476]